MGPKAEAGLGAVGGLVGESSDVLYGLINTGLRLGATEQFRQDTAGIPDQYRGLAESIGVANQERARDTYNQIQGSHNQWLSDPNNPARPGASAHLSLNQAHADQSYRSGATGIAQANYDQVYSDTKDAVNWAISSGQQTRAAVWDTVGTRMDQFSTNAAQTLMDQKSEIAAMNLSPGQRAQLEQQASWNVGEGLRKQSAAFMGDVMQIDISTRLATAQTELSTVLNASQQRAQAGGMVMQGFLSDQENAKALQNWQEGIFSDNFNRLGQADSMYIGLQQQALSMEYKRAGDLAALISGIASPLSDPNQRFDAGNIFNAGMQGYERGQARNAAKDQGGGGLFG